MDEGHGFDKIIFSRRLKGLIQQRHMTYAQLGEALNVTTAQISDMANGKAGTSLERLYLLCKQFDVSADYLLGLTDHPQGKNGAENEGAS